MPLMLQREYRAPCILDQVTPVGDIDVRGFAVTDQEQQFAIGFALRKIFQHAAEGWRDGKDPATAVAPSPGPVERWSFERA